MSPHLRLAGCCVPGCTLSLTFCVACYLTVHRLQIPNKIQLEADHHQRITTRFTLTDNTGKSITAHQTFIRLTNQKTRQEVIFVAEEDGAGAYRFDLVSRQ
jgi:hypothetical protein